MTLDRGRSLFLTCYAASGMAALIYQVTWTRLFTLELGHTVAASSTVLAAFMGGLAVGAWAAGTTLGASTSARRLQNYAGLEIAIALLALALPTLVRESRPLLAWAYADGDAPAQFAAIRVALSLALLGLPAAAMGATFPIAAAWFAGASGRSDRAIGGALGFLYAANAAGAAAGAIGAGFWLLPAFGARATTGIAAAINIAVAAAALWLARGDVQSARQAAPSTKPHAPSASRHASRAASTPRSASEARPLLAAAAAAISGSAALVYEVTWTRTIALIVGPTTYAFATMVAAFVTGIALGSAGGAALARRVLRPSLWLAAALVATAASATAASLFAGTRLPLLLAAQVSTGADFDAILPRQVFAVFLLLLPTGITLGATISLALATAASDIVFAGRDAARVYVANTLGAIAGALAGGFLLIPMSGLQGTIVATSRVVAILGLLTIAAVVWRRDGRRWVRGATAAAAVVCALLCAVVALPSWDRDLLSSGAYKYTRSVGLAAFETTLRAGTLEYYREGAAGTVSVRRVAGSRALAIDGKVDASNAGDMLTQRLLGALPVLLHRDPQDVLVIGLGSGVTVGAALASGPVRRADVVEISPEVVEASAFFASENRNALRASGVRLINGDGRSHLLLAARRYDVIVSEPSNPWMAGVAALFTREFFEAARERLEPDGLLCQWTHTYEMEPGDLKSIVASFASVFPDGTMWLVGDGDLLLIGGNGPGLESRLERLTALEHTRVLPDALADLVSPPSATAFVLLSLFAGGPAHIAAYSGDARVQVDDRMALEFSAPRAMYAAAQTDNTAEIRALASAAPFPALVTAALNDADSERWTARGAVALRADAFALAADSYRRAIALDGRNAEALRGASQAAARQGRIAAAQQWLESLAREQPSNPAVQIELSYVTAAAGQIDEAIAYATAAVRLSPDDPRPVEQLASVLADAGDADRLAPVADDLVSRFPDREDGRYYQAVSLMLQGRQAEAAAVARRLLSTSPNHARAQNLLGAACATIGDLACARAAFARSIEISSRDPSPYVNLGALALQTGDSSTAVRYFREALVVDAESAAARDGLARALDSVSAP
jgi:spermidine synthase